MVELADWGELLGNIPDDGSNFDESMVDVDNGYFTDDDNQFALDDATHTQARHMRQEWSTQEGELSSDIPSEIAIENGPQNEKNPQPEPELDIDQLPAPELFKQEKLVYISFDIETGGEYCGIVQISAQIFRVMNHNSTFESNIEPEIFDEYVKPPDDAIWDPRACDVHGLSVDDERIVNADGIFQVWNRFNSFVDRHVGLHQRAVLVAWNGKSCDLKWLYKICQAPRSSLQLNPRITYFMDPMDVIKHYKSCELNMAKTTPRIESYELGSVWAYLKKANLNEAHNSLVDAKAQTDIVCSSEFMPFLEKKRSYRSISNIWSATEQSEMKKKLESIREVHEPWTELEPDSNTWTPPRRNQYDGPNGGGVKGPSAYITNIMYRQGATLATLFLLLFPLTIFERIVKHTNFYAYEENVKLVDAKDRDGNVKKKRQFVSCHERDPERRTRAPMKIFEATVGYVIAWFGILIYHGAQCPGCKLKYWKKSPRGLPQAFIQNTMSFKAFEFLRRYIHFEDNRNCKPKTHPLFDPLWKIRWALDSVSKNIRKAYNAGKDVTIDESMIRYRGRAVSFVQYMPKKPIKHGIKVFALCCAVTAYLLGFEVYLGKEFTRSVESTAVNVVERLIVEADLVKAKGRTLYTDNWYTSMDLAKHLYENHGWTLVGTITPTDKKARSDHDVPFLKLSNGGLKAVPRGWYREAMIEISSANNNRYFIQCTTWRDKKQVMFLHTKLVSPSVAHQVKRHVKGKQQRVDLSAPSIQKEYAANFNAVDRNDCDSAHHTCSIRTNRWYLRIKFWLLDRVVFSCYILVCEMAQDEACPYKDEWKKYLDKHEGRENFQIDLGLALISYGIEYDWPDRSQPKPRLMRQTELKPCECEECFFCTTGQTNGIFHNRAQVEYTSPDSGRKRLKTVRCDFERKSLGMKSGSYCRQCRRKKIKPESYSTKGCRKCGEPICEDCWDSGYDKISHNP